MIEIRRLSLKLCGFLALIDQIEWSGFLLFTMETFFVFILKTYFYHSTIFSRRRFIVLLAFIQIRLF